MKESSFFVRFVRPVILVAISVIQVVAAPASLLDDTFGGNPGPNAPVAAVALQMDGKVMIGGSFTDVDGVTRRGIARLNSNGTLDASFNPALGPGGECSSLAIQSDGKILALGTLSAIGGVPRFGLLRFNTDGSLDGSFNPKLDPTWATRSFALQTDGKILLTGSFTDAAGSTRNNIIRLNSDGGLDSNFKVPGYPATTDRSDVYSVAVDAAGKVLVGGKVFLGMGFGGFIWRSNADGSFDDRFTVGNLYALFPGLREVRIVAPDPSGRVFIVGTATPTSISAGDLIGRLNSDGSKDDTFASLIALNGSFRAAVRQTDGKLLVGGSFFKINETQRNGLARANTDGSLDPNFIPISGDSGVQVWSIAIQSDGRILTGGNFTTINGVPRKYVARFLAGETPSNPPVLNCVPAPAGLVARWPADGSATDAIGKNHGLVAAGVAYAPGKSGQAFSFDGLDQSIQLPDSDALKLTQSFSITAWIQVNALPPRDRNWAMVLFRGDERGGLDPYFLGVNPDGKLVFHIDGLSGNASVEAPVAIGKFMHVAGTLDDATGKMRLYIDGARVAETTTSARPFRDLLSGSLPGIAIGNAQRIPESTTRMPFKGLIDELAMYSRELSALEIQSIYNAGSAGLCNPPIITAQPKNQSSTAGETVTLSITASDSAVLSYQWFKDGVAIPGATAATHTISNVQASHAGTYSVAVSSSSGKVTSADAILTVLPAASAQPSPSGPSGFQLLHAFGGARDGISPEGKLVQGIDGALYGATSAGGADKQGTVFKLNPNGTGYAILHSFTGAGGDGSSPLAGLVMGTDGSLYGTTSNGGRSFAGTVFKIKPDGTGYTILYHFTGGLLSTTRDGANPQATLLIGKDGALYGTTYGGGTNSFGVGTIFKVNSDGTGYVQLRSFGSSDPAGFWPTAGLVQGSDGTLFGTTSFGGASSGGTAFKINPDGTGFAVLRAFAFADGINPVAGLLIGFDGFLYGTTKSGGANFSGGTAFKMKTDGTGFTVLRSFGGLGGASVLYGNLLAALDGAFYGVASAGGTSNSGTLFKINSDGTGYTVLYNFKGDSTDGNGPAASLIQGIDGALYGTTSLIGKTNSGTLFRYGLGSPFVLSIKSPTSETTYSTTNSTLHFSGVASSAAGITQVTWTNSLSGGGIASGTTNWSVNGIPLLTGTNVLTVVAQDAANSQQFASVSVVFTLPAPPESRFQVLHTFTGNDGTPASGVIQASDGAFYGSMSLGFGKVFKMNPDGSGYTVLHTFTGLTGDGAGPNALVQGHDGAIYGTTRAGVSFNVFGANVAFGSVFKLNPDGNGFIQPRLFSWDAYSGGDGISPNGPLTQGQDGLFYGTTYSGGLSNVGVVFGLNPDLGNYSVLHTFKSVDGDGFSAVGGVIQGKDGALYGTTSQGGAFGFGTVFKVNADGNAYQHLHHFKGHPADGGRPMTGLIQGMDGALYGTANLGGGSFGVSGAIFKLNTDGSGYAVLHWFSGTAGDGSTPSGGLVQAADGTLYGTTETGGSNNNGIIFRMNTDGSGYTVLRSFASNDGTQSQARLAFGTDGALYGTTSRGGNGSGTVFRLILSNLPAIEILAPTTAPTFSTTRNTLNLSGTASSSAGPITITWANNRGGNGNASGSSPWSLSGVPLLSGANVITVTARDAAGKQQTASITAVYGPTDTTAPALAVVTPTAEPFYAAVGKTIRLGGTASDNLGVTQIAWTNDRGGSGSTTDNPTWSFPSIPLQTGTNHITVTARDAANNQRSVELTVVATPPAIAFTAPSSGPIYSTANNKINLSGTTESGFGGVALVTWANSIGGSRGTASGAGPWSVPDVPLQRGTNLITVTAWDTVGNQQSAVLTVVCTALAPSLNPSFQLLHSFTGTAGDGAVPQGALLESTDGFFYGTTPYGGPGAEGPFPGYGTIFKLKGDGSNYAVAYGMPTNQPPEKALPVAGLLQAKDGTLFGTTEYGARSAKGGTVFKLRSDGTDFRIVLGDVKGNALVNRLVQASDGALYGVSADGGTNRVFAVGEIFKLNLDGTGFVILREFDASIPWAATHPQSIIEGKDGLLYGIAACGGTNNFGQGGVVFSVKKDGSGYAILHTFNSSVGDQSFQNLQRAGLLSGDGFSALGYLAQGTDGALYGTTEFGGAENGGVVYKLNPDGSGYRILHSFGSSGTDDGKRPKSGLTFGRDGALYGATYFGGKFGKESESPGHGTIFRLNSDGTDYAVLHDFDGANGSWPIAGLALGSDGSFYGTTAYGGALRQGTVFKLSVQGSSVLNFTGIKVSPAGALLELSGTPGQAYVIEAATDLRNPAWQAISTNSAAANGAFQFLDPAAPSHPIRFYRGVHR